MGGIRRRQAAKRPAGTPDTGLLDLIAEAEHDEPLAVVPPTLLGSPARGLPARAAEFSAWRPAYGSFGSHPRSHAWTLACTHPGEPASRCQPTVLTAGPQCSHDWRQRCQAAGDLLYRGACRACPWEGPARDRENPATKDACDHAWPGWRDLPAVEPNDPKALASWTRRVTALYPPGWVEDGGPVRTRRAEGAGRHNKMHRLGYSMGA